MSRAYKLERTLGKGLAFKNKYSINLPSFLRLHMTLPKNSLQFLYSVS